jgi:DNA modification methylase
MTPYYEQDGITIYHGDCREVAPTLPPADLVVTSPPYADQRRYGFKKGEFRWDHVVPRALASVNLSPEGQMLVNLGLVHRDGEVVCYWEPMIHALRAFGYRLFGWYVWDQGAQMPGDWSGRLGPSHEWVFHFNRTSRAALKSQSNKTAGQMRRAGKTSRVGGCSSNQDRTLGLYAVAERRVPDSVFRVPRGGRQKSAHPASFPASFAERLVATFDGTVIDPFMGGGTTLLAAKSIGRRAIGIEIEERYCEIAAQRLVEASGGAQRPLLEQPA